MKIEQFVQEFEEEYNYRVVYVTEYGSKLYGTDNPNSDTDYKGIFIPTLKSVLLKRDIEHYNFNTNNMNTKNSKDDIDLQLFSIYKWFTLLKKGETGAMDILFSFFREDTQAYVDSDFSTLIKENYQRFYNKNLHSFLGYCVGQSKMYNIRGERFGELHSFVEYFNVLVEEKSNDKLSTIYPQMEEIIAKKKYKYIQFVSAPTSRGVGETKDGIYIEVLGKRFLGTVSIGYFSEKITTMEEQFGNRARASANGVDYKALSHAVRVIDEVEELIDTGFITFPLPNKVYITSVKEGKQSLEDVMDYIDKKLNIVQEKLENSKLPERSDELFIDKILLNLVLNNDKM